MKKPRVLTRVREAIRVFREGYPASGFKAWPVAWPTAYTEAPAWRLVDIETYMREGFSLNSLIYSAVMYKVRATAPAPLRGYTGSRRYPEELKDDHPLQVRLASPNGHQSWTEFQALNYVYWNVAGETFIYTDRQSGELIPLRPDRVWIVAAKRSRAKADIIGYRYVPEGASRYDADSCIPFLAEDIVHIKMPNPLDPLDGLGYGLSPITACAQSADVDNMITSFLNVFFKKGAQVMALLSFQASLTPELVEDIRKRWRKLYGGYKNWDIGVLDRGGKYERVGLTFEEMGFKELDGRDETRILGPFGVPPILIGAKSGLDRATYSNQEGAREMCWQDTLYPELMFFQAEYQRYFNDGENFVLFDVSRIPALQRGIPKLVNAAYQLCEMRVPPNQAIYAVGLSDRVGYIEGGDEPIELSQRERQVRNDEQDLLRRPESEVGGVYDYESER